MFDPAQIIAVALCVTSVIRPAAVHTHDGQHGRGPTLQFATCDDVKGPYMRTDLAYSGCFTVQMHGEQEVEHDREQFVRAYPHAEHGSMRSFWTIKPSSISILRRCA